MGVSKLLRELHKDTINLDIIIKIIKYLEENGTDDPETSHHLEDGVYKKFISDITSDKLNDLDKIKEIGIE